MTTVILCGPRQRTHAKTLIDMAPKDAVLSIKEGTRSLDQNAKMWAMLTDIARAKIGGREWSEEVWKAGFMHDLIEQVAFYEGIRGEGFFPVSYRTSQLSKKQFADLLTNIAQYGDEHGVEWRGTPQGVAS